MILSLTWKGDLILLVLQIGQDVQEWTSQNLWKNLKWYGLNTLAQMLNLHQLFVNITSFLTNFSSDSKNGSRKIIDFCSSYNHSGIIRSTLFLLKYSMAFLIKLIKTFFMPCTSFSKSVAFLSIYQLWDYVYTWSDFPRPVYWKFFWLTVNFCLYFTPTSN